jgi:hypothetical protein
MRSALRPALRIIVAVLVVTSDLILAVLAQ